MRGKNENVLWQSCGEQKKNNLHNFLGVKISIYLE